MDAFYASVEQRDDPVAARQTGGRGLARRTFGGVRGQLRGAAVRRALGDAGGARRAAVPAGDLRAAGLSPLQGGIAADPRDLRAPHRPDRAAVAGRGLSGRHRDQERARLGHRDRRGDPRGDPRGNRPDRLGRRGAEQVPRQDRLGPPQAGWPVRGAPAPGRRLSAAAESGPAARRGQGHGEPAGRAGRRHRGAVAHAAAGRAGAAFRPLGPTAARIVAGHRPPSRCSRSG